jgi:TolB-like protein/DNA-binding SARP family transcriptional activator
LEGAKAVTPNLRPYEEYIDPGYQEGRVRPVLPRIYLIGNMRAVATGGACLLPNAKKARGIVACLCLAQGEPVTRSRLKGLLWERSADAQARMSLRHALSEINHTVNRYVPGLIQIRRESVRLDLEKCWVDALAILEASFDLTSAASNLFLNARLLEDLDGMTYSFDRWLAAERARFVDRMRKILETELNRLIAQNAKPEVRATAARRLINFEPTHEDAARSLMTALAQMGNRADAVREFERCRQVLRTVLNLSPSTATSAVYEAIRTESPLVAPEGDVAAHLTEGTAGRSSAMTAVRWKREKQSDAIIIPSGAENKQRRELSVAVLPFRSLTADPAHGFIAEGLIEDLIEALSRVPNLFVISRLSTLAFRNQDRQPGEIGDALGVRYVISGSLRVLGNRVRLSVELTDTQPGTVLWFSKIDEQFVDVFQVQDCLSEMIVRNVARCLHVAEVNRVRVKRPGSLEAYDLLLRAKEKMYNSSRKVFESAEPLFDAAIEKDPHYGSALAWRAYWHVLRVGQGWSPDPAIDAARADDFARSAIELDSRGPMGFAVHGHVASYLNKDFDLASRSFETALSIDANAALAWLWSAATQVWMGNDVSRAIEEINKAIALSPYDPLMYAFSSIASIAYLSAGQYERAIECALRSLRENRTYTASHRLLVIALALSGREAEAGASVQRLLELEPGLTVAGFRRRYPGSGSPHADLFCDALAEAGVPLCA